MRQRSLPHSSFAFAVTSSAALASLGLMAGLGLQNIKEHFITLSPLVIALPAMNAVAGDYASIITAHLDDPTLYPQRLKKLMLGLLAAVPVSIAGITMLSLFIATLQGYELSDGEMYRYAAFYGISIVGVVLVVFVTGLIGNRVLRHHRINSDDVLIPIINGIASVLMLGCFTVAALYYF